MVATKNREAAARRNIPPDTNAYRLIYSEGDLLPSLIVDRYDDVFVMQTLSQGTDALKPLLIEILVEEFNPRAVIERNDARVRELEGLPLIAGRFTAMLRRNWKSCNTDCVSTSSHSADRRPDHFWTSARIVWPHAPLRKRRTNNAHSIASLSTARLRCISPGVRKRDWHRYFRRCSCRRAAKRGAERLDNVEFREANVFDVLRELEAAGERFDVIVLDPPAFAKNRASLKAAIRGYKEINLRALKLLNPGGVLVTCTCSYHVSEELFLEILDQAAIDARRRVQVVEKRMQATDHPVLLGMPETYYLKCLITRVI